MLAVANANAYGGGIWSHGQQVGEYVDDKDPSGMILALVWPNAEKEVRSSHNHGRNIISPFRLPPSSSQSQPSPYKCDMSGVVGSCVSFRISPEQCPLSQRLHHCQVDIHGMLTDDHHSESKHLSESPHGVDVILFASQVETFFPNTPDGLYTETCALVSKDYYEHGSRRSFHAKPWPKQHVVVLAGQFTHGMHAIPLVAPFGHQDVDYDHVGGEQNSQVRMTMNTDMSSFEMLALYAIH